MPKLSDGAVYVMPDGQVVVASKTRFGDWGLFKRSEEYLAGKINPSYTVKDGELCQGIVPTGYRVKHLEQIGG